MPRRYKMEREATLIADTGKNELRVLNNRNGGLIGYVPLDGYRIKNFRYDRVDGKLYRTEPDGQITRLTLRYPGKSLHFDPDSGGLGLEDGDGMTPFPPSESTTKGLLDEDQAEGLRSMMGTEGRGFQTAADIERNIIQDIKTLQGMLAPERAYDPNYLRGVKALALTLTEDIDRMEFERG